MIKKSKILILLVIISILGSLKINASFRRKLRRRAGEDTGDTRKPIEYKEVPPLIKSINSFMLDVLDTVPDYEYQLDNMSDDIIVQEFNINNLKSAVDIPNNNEGEYLGDTFVKVYFGKTYKDRINDYIHTISGSIPLPEDIIYINKEDNKYGIIGIEIITENKLILKKLDTETFDRVILELKINENSSEYEIDNEFWGDDPNALNELGAGGIFMLGINNLLGIEND